MLTLVNKHHINNEFRNQLAGQGIAYTEMKTVPLPLTNFLWMGIARMDDTFHVGYHSIFDKNDTIDFSSIRRNELLIIPLMKDRRVRNLVRFTRGYYAAVFDSGGLIVNDLRFGRFGMDDDSPYIFAFRIKSDGQNIEIDEADNSGAMSEEAFDLYIRRIFGSN
jgi:inner membrane protein